MFVLESEKLKTNAPSFEEMFHQTVKLLNDLFASHQIEVQPNKISGKLINICLVGNATAPDTYLCLKIQAMWYATRKFPYTMLALKDRDPLFKNELPSFSPFVTYLRFHADELIFLGIIIRLLKGFKALKKFWMAKSASKKLPGSIKLPDIAKTDQAIIKNAFEIIKAIKIDSSHPIKTWISLGLVEYYTNKRNNPKWFTLAHLNTSSQDYITRKTEASIALQIITIIKKYELVATLNLMLEYTPIHIFFDEKVFENEDKPEKRLFMSKVFTKAHSFERVRLVYKEAHEHLGS
jgi:hypothetical protein